MMSKTFESLLDVMPAIAKAVNKFESKETRIEALRALIAAFGIQSGATSTVGSESKKDSIDSGGAKKNTQTPKSGKKRAKTTTAKEAVEAVRSLDLRPEGKVPFREFVDQKEPKSNQDKFAVAIFWMEQIAEISPITQGHVAAIFKQTNGWREPGNIRVGLTSTASRKNTIDTANLDDLKTTPHGRNFVNLDLPGDGDDS